jgi:hypothetical protein
VCCHWPIRLISRHPRAQALFHSTSGQPLVAAADGGAAAPDKLWRACLRCKPCSSSCKPLRPPSHSILLLLAAQPHPHSSRHSTARRTTTIPPRITSDDVPGARPTCESGGACSRQIQSRFLARCCHRIVRLGGRFLLGDRQDAISATKPHPTGSEALHLTTRQKTLCRPVIPIATRRAQSRPLIKHSQRACSNRRCMAIM